MNIAYIDGQNLFLGLKTLGCTIDWNIFFQYLQKRYDITEAKLFLGYLDKHHTFYNDLKQYGYTLIFRKTHIIDGIVKGNVDSVMVLEVVRDVYTGLLDKAYIVTGDGDFDVLISFLEQEGKLGKLLCPDSKKASRLLKQATKTSNIQDMKTIIHIISKIG